MSRIITIHLNNHTVNVLDEELWVQEVTNSENLFCDSPFDLCLTKLPMVEDHLQPFVNVEDHSIT